MDQHAGKDKRVVIIRDEKSYVIKRKWNVTKNNTLQSRIKRCCAAYFEIETTPQHVTEKIPNQHTQVQNFLDYIESCTDPKVCIFVAAVSNEINGMSDDFELVVAHLLPELPVSTKLGSKRNNAQISTLGGDLKTGTVTRTEFQLRYYRSHE